LEGSEVFKKGLKTTGYQPKKSKIFTNLEIERFIKQANVKEFLLAKLVLIVIHNYTFNIL